MSPQTIEGLTASRAERLAALEATIEEGLQTFRRVGAALAEIRDGHLYRETHDNFADYCTERWELSRSHAYRMIDAEQVASTLASPNGDKTPPPPKHEAHARALAPLKDKPGELRDVWREVHAQTDGNPTSQDVIEAVRARVEPQSPPATEPPPEPDPAPEPPPEPPQDAAPPQPHTYNVDQLESMLATAMSKCADGLLQVVPSAGVQNGYLLTWGDGERTINSLGNTVAGTSDGA